MASRQGLVDVTEAAAAFYWQQLRGRLDGWAVGHLSERGLDAVYSRDLQWVGYAPEGWSRLVVHLRRSGFDDEVIVGAGLASPTSNGYLVDRFRDRIMFVARDIDLQPVGFIGRARGSRLRYLNTPNTDIYAKGRTVVGIDGHPQSGAIPVFVEGTMDAAAVNQLGGNWAAAACCGTAITHQQALIVKKHSQASTVIVALDGDLGGRTGAVRSLDVLSDRFTQVLYAGIPDKHDPSSLLAADRDQLVKVLTSARPLVDVAIEGELARWAQVLDHISGQVNAVRAVAPLLVRLPAARVAGEIAKLARTVHLDEQVVSREVLAATGRRQASRLRRRRICQGLDAREPAPDPPDCSRTP